MQETRTVELDTGLVERLMAARPSYNTWDFRACVHDALEGWLRSEAADLREELARTGAELRMELGTMLRGLRGIATHIDESGDALPEEEFRRYLSVLRRNAELALAYSSALERRITVLLRPLRREEIDVSQLATQIIQDLWRVTPKRKAQVSITEGMRLRADLYLVRMALEVLLDNAWKFTGECDVAVITMSRDGSQFVIADNGIGFLQERAEYIFGEGSRLRSAQRFSGVGFGLALARRIVERHGGTIAADGTPGKGARFRFDFGSESILSDAS
jgi:signal transduction histidine kinase